MRRHMRSITIFIVAVLCSVSVAYGAIAKKPSIDPRAQQILRQMSDYLSGLQTFSVHVDAVVEGVTKSGERLDADRSADLWLQRPDKLRVNLTSAHHNAQMFYDGNNFTIFTPAKNYYAQWNAPRSIDEVITIARTKYGLALPGADFLMADPYTRLMANAKSGAYLGDVTIGGVMTHHLAFRQPDVDWQIWVQADATPVPRRVVINDKRTTGEPKYMASFRDWNASPVIEPSTFVFTPPAGAAKIKMQTLPSIKRQVTPRNIPRKGVYK